MKMTLLPLALIVGAAPIAYSATLIDFESPYTLGALVTATPGLENKTFVGQQSWSDSTSSSGGNNITTTTSGNYIGGQGLTGSTTATAQTYIGAKAVGGLDSYSFDFRYYGVELGVGGWNDDDTDGLFDHTETEFVAGVVATSGSTWAFGVRTANFGSRLSSGTAGTFGNWYRMTVTPNSVTSTVTLGVHDLTSNIAVPLANSVFNLTAAEFGVATTAYEGIVARVTSSSINPGTLDNIQIIPEPSAALLGGLGILGLLLRRRVN